MNRIRLGVCTSLDNAGVLAGLGYDYVETGLTAVVEAGELLKERRDRDAVPKVEGI